MMREGAKARTAEDESILRENAGKKTLKEIAGEIGRSYSSVYSKIINMGLPVLKETNTWTDEEDRKLVDMLSEYKYTYADLAKEFGRTENAVRTRCNTIGTPMRALRKGEKNE